MILSILEGTSNLPQNYLSQVSQLSQLFHFVILPCYESVIYREYDYLNDDDEIVNSADAPYT
jgi:hypothetical protein